MQIHTNFHCFEENHQIFQNDSDTQGRGLKGLKIQLKTFPRRAWPWTTLEACSFRAHWFGNFHHSPWICACYTMLLDILHTHVLQLYMYASSEYMIKAYKKKNNQNQGVFDFHHGQSWTYYLFFYFSLFIFRLCTISLSSFLTCTSLWLPHLSLFLNLELDIFTLTGALW